MLIAYLFWILFVLLRQNGMIRRTQQRVSFQSLVSFANIFLLCTSLRKCAEQSYLCCWMGVLDSGISKMELIVSHLSGCVKGLVKTTEVGPEIQVVALLFSFCVCRDERTIVDPMKSRGKRRKSKSSTASELASLQTTIGGRKIEEREGRTPSSYRNEAPFDDRQAAHNNEDESKR